MKRPRALVIGAGIGGMAAAIALRRAGLDVSLFEQTIAQREVGAGIQISPNASRLLGRYGFGDAMARVAVRPSAIVFRRWQDGRVLGREELGDPIESQYGAPYYPFHRADLINLLAEAFGPRDIELGRRLVDIEQGRNRCDRPLSGWRIRAWRSPYRSGRNTFPNSRAAFRRGKATVLWADRVSGTCSR